METNSPGEGGKGGFHVSTAGLDEAHQKLTAVREYFQAKADTLAALGTPLQDPFFGGHEGETGAFKRNYEVFGTEWLRQLQRVLVLEQRFVNLIGAHAEAVKNASAMYAHADVNARKALQSILEEM